MTIATHQTRTVPTPSPIPTPPPIYVTEADFETLSNLAETPAGRALGGRVLADEMARAVIVEPDQALRPFVRIGSTVAFEDLSNGQTRIVRLSLPRDASLEDHRISVLSPVGAALVGMTAGQAFHWIDAERRQRGVRVLSVQA
jgi:regulator of nucleoside diphosphate kinase